MAIRAILASFGVLLAAFLIDIGPGPYPVTLMALIMLICVGDLLLWASLVAEVTRA